MPLLFFKGNMNTNEFYEKLNKQAKLFQDNEIRVLGEELPFYGDDLPF